jgi:hypothetical protein
MATNEMSSEDYARLRCQAEERIKQWSHYNLNEHMDLHKVIHELQIHLAEQEILNEELWQTMNSIYGGEKGR